MENHTHIAMMVQYLRIEKDFCQMNLKGIIMNTFIQQKGYSMQVFNA